jgi:hypothetical protein
LLIAELERALLRGDEVPGGDFLLQEVRSALRDSSRQTARLDHAARAFFRPLEPFLVDDQPSRKHQARIARSSLPSLWDWICRDLLPEAAERFSDARSHAAPTDPADGDQLSRSFQDQVCEQVRLILADAQSDDKTRRRIIGQIGIPMALESVRDLLAILAGRDLLTLLSSRLPGHIQNLADGELDDIKAMLDACAGRQEEFLPYGLVLVMGRLAAPWQLIRLAVRAAESDDAVRVAATPYATAVAITLADIERMVGDLKADLKGGTSLAVTSLLKCIHDAVRGLRSELDLAVDLPWGRRLAAIRSEVSDALRAEIESTPGRVRRLLRPRLAGKAASAAALDPDDVAETEALIELLGACRQYASELAVSEMTLRAYTELQQYLDTGTQSLLDGLRSGEPAERPFQQSQIDAALRFCRRVFGAEYAALLGKAAEVAAHSERKVAAKA